jgi:hypothetical protein
MRDAQDSALKLPTAGGLDEVTTVLRVSVHRPL